MVSPMIVDRRWPTCISLAMFGDEKSTTTFFRPFFRSLGSCGTGSPRRREATSEDTFSKRHAGATFTLMKPCDKQAAAGGLKFARAF